MAAFEPFLLTLQNAKKYYGTYFSLLNQLTSSPALEMGEYLKLLEQLLSHTFIFIVVDSHDTVVGSASILVEQKLIKGGCKVGHLEDVVVDAQMRGKGIGIALVEACKRKAKEEGCFKIILDCGEKNVPFYEKCGFKSSGLEMNCVF